MPAAEPLPLSASVRPTRTRWLIFVLACAASWLLYLHRYSWNYIKPRFVAENPDLTRIDIGWLDSAFVGAYALGQVPGGLAGDVLGARRVLTALILLWSLAAAAVGWVSGFWEVAAVRAVFGLTQAGAYPVLSKTTRNWFPLSIRTSVQGVVAAMGRLGAASCSLILMTLLIGWLGLSWRNALWVLAVPGLALAAAVWLFVRGSPNEHPWSNAAERQRIDAGRGPAPAGDPVHLRLGPAELVSLGMLLLYAFASTFQDQLYVNWTGSFLVEGRGLDEAQMGLFATLPLLGGAAGAILGGMLNDVLLRAGYSRRWVRSGVAFTGKLTAAVLVLLSVQVADGRAAMAVLLAARVFGDWSLATQWGAITDMGGRAAATVFGLVNTAGALGGFVAGPCLGRLLRDYGWEGLFGGVAALCALSAVTWLFIDCTRRLVPD